MQSSLALFLALTTFAILMQAAVLLGILLSLRKLNDQVERANREIQSGLVREARDTMVVVRGVAENLRAVSDHLVVLTAAARQEFDRIEDMVGETGDALRVQIEKFDRLTTEVVGRVNETVDIVQESIVRPVREITAIAKGVSRGLDILMRRQRSTVDQARQDEELFI